MFLLEILAVFALLVGAATYFLIRKAKGGRLHAVASALVLSPLLTCFLFVSIQDCDISAYLKSELENGLSAAELATLKADRWICPVGYTYVRNGVVHTAIVVPGLFRPKIFIGDDKSP